MGSDVAIRRADGRVERKVAKFLTTVDRGDVFQVRLAGGGGHGDPMQRDPGAVREDVLDGKMTAGHARDAYGVVLAGPGLALDEEGTRLARQAAVAARAPA
jgi:N-methylhydantoinase B